MAKYYGIGGRRIGSVGNETYTMVKSNNIVKAKIIHVNDARTPEQIEQRSKLENTVKAYRQIGPDFLRKCFEFKKKQQSTYNAFVSANTRLAKAFFKRYSADPNVFGIGIFKVSDGSLPRLPVKVTDDVVVDDITYTYYGVEIKKELTKDSTVGQISTDLIERYHLERGMFLNALGMYNEGVTYNAASVQDPLSFSAQYFIQKDKRNFELNPNDETVITEKGFTVVGGENKKWLILTTSFAAQDGTASPGCVRTRSDDAQYLGYCAYFTSQKSNGKIKVSTSLMNINSIYQELVAAIEANPLRINGWLATVMKVLIITSYGIKKIIEIIRDWPI